MHFFTTVTIITLLASLALSAPIPAPPGDGPIRGKDVIIAAKDTLQAAIDERAAAARRAVEAKARADALVQREKIRQAVIAREKEKEKKKN